MTKFLLKKFIKNDGDAAAPEVREAYGKLAGVTGLITNIILALMKGLIGFFSGSIAVIADAFNNLSDAVSSLITLVGFKMAAKEKDADHPYGHARIEYMTGIVIAALIILLGFKLFSSSYEKAIHPEPIAFSVLTAVFLLVAIGAKIWQTVFNFSLAKRIHSGALRAIGVDSRNDVITTSVVLASLVFGYFTGINIDGYTGVVVALFIMYSGVMLIRETSRPLLGQAPDPDLVNRIATLIREKDGVMGMHDLVVHDYGPGRLFASVHIEVDAAEDVLKSHEVIDDIEREAMRKLKIELVGHMDPIDTKDPLVYELREKITRLLIDTENVVGMHDLRIVRGEHRINVIFDVVLALKGAENKTEREEKLLNFLEENIKALDPKYEIAVTFDTDYTATL
ncbi:MAG: cation diffusion facilitator family transporter [Clostridiales Family XIII bacterium]|jgi:cation diffusion facilitator family transporter|nr:cation diffusion facilitator family transporter [Clostridiales Family XIII bacterium]